MTILWDRGKIHDRSRVVRAYLAEAPGDRDRGRSPATPRRPTPTRGCGAHQARPAGELRPRGHGRAAGRAGRGVRRGCTAARAAGVVHPARQDPDPVTVLVPLATLESVERKRRRPEPQTYGRPAGETRRPRKRPSGPIDDLLRRHLGMDLGRADARQQLHDSLMDAGRLERSATGLDRLDPGVLPPRPWATRQTSTATGRPTRPTASSVLRRSFNWLV